MSIIRGLLEQFSKIEACHSRIDKETTSARTVAADLKSDILAALRRPGTRSSQGSPRPSSVTGGRTARPVTAPERARQCVAATKSTIGPTHAPRTSSPTRLRIHQVVQLEHAGEHGGRHGLDAAKVVEPLACLDRGVVVEALYRVEI